MAETQLLILHHLNQNQMSQNSHLHFQHRTFWLILLQQKLKECQTETVPEATDTIYWWLILHQLNPKVEKSEEHNLCTGYHEAVGSLCMCSLGLSPWEVLGLTPQGTPAVTATLPIPTLNIPQNVVRTTFCFLDLWLFLCACLQHSSLPSTEGQLKTGQSEMCPCDTAPVTTENSLQHCHLQDSSRHAAWPGGTALREKLHSDFAGLKKTAAFVKAPNADVWRKRKTKWRTRHQAHVALDSEGRGLMSKLGFKTITAWSRIQCFHCLATSPPKSMSSPNASH